MKALLPIALLLIASGVYFFVTQGPEGGTSGGDPSEIVTPIKPDAGKSAQDVYSKGLEGPKGATDGERKAAGDGERKAIEPEKLPQGAEGRVFSSLGGPVAGATVYLIRTVPTSDMLVRMVQLQRTGAKYAADAAVETKTDERGGFTVSAPPSVGERSYELHVVAKGFEVHRQPLRLAPGKWHKLQPITIKAGRRLVGFVRDEKTRAPIEGATVQVQLPQINMLLITPGFEDGAVAKSDRNGRYEVLGLPVGSFEVRAFAKGYGIIKKDSVVFGESDRELSEEFLLPKGYEIEGYVIDGLGKPIPRARVEAEPLSQNYTTVAKTFADQDGYFSILGVPEGQFIVKANARGFVEGSRKPVKSGEKEVKVVLEKQGEVRVRVLSKQGRALSSYRLELRTFFDGQETYGRSEVEPQEVRGARNGEYLFTGINPGKYVFQVDANAYAKTYSKPFELKAGAQQPIEVTVRMNAGGTITGIVTDTLGNPLPGVSVKTLENSFQDNPIFQFFGSLVPEMVTHVTVATGKDGRFTLKRLSPAKYQLRIEHPQYTRVYKKDIDVQESSTLDVGMLRLAKGGTVSGRVFFQGRPVAGAEVSLSSSPNSKSKAAPVFEKAFTDATGSFKFARSLPAGMYEIQAARNDVANPFLKIKDMQTSKKEIRIADGRDNPVNVVIKN